MMRRVAASGREVHEERLVGILRSNPMDPLDGLVRHGVGEVVGILVVVEPLRGPDHLLVLDQARVPLARVAGEEAVEVVEPPTVRPAIERTCRALLPVGRQMPLPVRGGAVAVVAQDARQRRAVPRQGRRVAGEPAGELTDRAEPDGVVVATRQQRGAGRRAEGRHVEPVVLESLIRHARVIRCLDRAPERARVAEAGVVDQDEQDVGCALRRHRMSDQVPVRL